MKATTIRSGIDSVANQSKSFAKEAGVQLTRAADALSRVVSEAVGSTKADARQREVLLAKEIAAMARHRRQELADSARRKRFDQ
jgi:hypothetical protein